MLCEGKKILLFCCKLMVKVEGFMFCFDFFIYVVFLCLLGKWYRMLFLLCWCVIDVLLQVMCFYYDLLVNCVQCLIINMVIECGLVIEFRSGNLLVSCVIWVLKFLVELGFIIYQIEYDLQIGCNILIDIIFILVLFFVFDVFEVVVVVVCCSCVEWENLQCKKQKLKFLEMDELIVKVWWFVCECFCSYQVECKFYGCKWDIVWWDVLWQCYDIEMCVCQ